MQAKSFIDILAHELRKEIRAEVEAELAASSRVGAAARVESSHKAESVELWLNLRMGGALSGNQSLGQSVNRYQTSANRPQSASASATASASAIRQLQQPVKPAPVRERTGKVASIEQTFALEFFKREGSTLASEFSESQLKSEFRKIALRIHPDRHTGASVEQLRSLSTRFQTLVESAEVLESALQ